jgi:hypothetical protein
LLHKIATTSFISFIERAYNSHPELFSSSAQLVDTRQLYSELIPVVRASERLQWMQQSSDEKWSEADFAANVYAFTLWTTNSILIIGLKCRFLVIMSYAALPFKEVDIGEQQFMQ